MNRTTLILSSSAVASDNISQNGAQFVTTLPEPLRFPEGTKHVQLRLLSASIWNSVPNLVDCTFKFSTLLSPAITVQIPKGQYSVSLLDAALNRALTNSGYDPNIVAIVADESTQKIGIQFTSVGSSISFDVDDPLAKLLGFNSLSTYGPTTLINQTIVAPNVAAFNSVNQFQIHSTLVEQGIPYGNQYTRLIGQVPIAAAPGSLINYEPTNAPACSADSLLGGVLQRVTSVLTDEKNMLVDTNGETWTYTVDLRWF